jgi:hypothetical protein
MTALGTFVLPETSWQSGLVWEFYGWTGTRPTPNVTYCGESHFHTNLHPKKAMKSAGRTLAPALAVPNPANPPI